jgi:predicted Zn-dependent peptidase
VISDSLRRARGRHSELQRALVRSRDAAFLTLALIAVALAPTTAAAQAPVGARSPTLDSVDLPVRKILLDNGMRVLVLPRPGAPTVGFVVQYAVGSVNEKAGETGIAHVLEHMLFKGTTTVGTRDVNAERALFARMDVVHDTLLRARAANADSSTTARLASRIGSLEDSARAFVETNEFDLLLTTQGARGLNASTSNEATTYYVELPANRAELWFVLEADRMTNPVFREFYAERDVVMEERRMRVDDSPGGRLYEAHMAAAFREHPFGVPVIGYMKDLESLTRAKVEEYYRRFYGPNNAVVAVVGDVDPDEIERLARRYFAPIPAAEPPPPVTVVEPQQTEERRVTVTARGGAQLRIGWHVPDALHEDAPALEMLSVILTGGRNSRLYHELVLDDRIAAQIVTGLSPGDLYPRIFTIDAVPRSPHTTAEIEAAVYAELDRLSLIPPSEAELDRVRSQLEAGEVRRLRSNLGLAFQLAGSESGFGDWRETWRMTRRLGEVTPDDVQRVVRRYFTASNRTVATLVSEP